ncbi:MAG: DUF22 domain-containing protein [Candidatus Thorarchaeota archaeon]|nr:DUF22 domain-containing protein [Candidatus Thorarchaeota archaeon]
MSEKIYVISCSEDLKSMGMDRMRTGMEGMGEIVLSLDWSKVRFVPIVAAERAHFKEGETKILSIRSITVPPYAMVIQSFYGVNGMGHATCIGSMKFARPDSERVADKAMFRSRLDASVLPGDLLGQVFIVPGKKA